MTADGELVDPKTLETVLMPRASTRSGPTLGDVLVPIASRDVSIETIALLLRQIELVDQEDVASERPHWIALDGRWRLGPLHGRWLKDRAEHIGAGTRAAARARRLAEIELELTTLRARLGELEERNADVSRRRSVLTEAAAGFPSGAKLLELRAILLQLQRVAVKAQRQLEDGQRELVNIGIRVKQAEDALATAAAKADLIDAVEDLEGRAEALRGYQLALAELASACELHLKAVSDHARTKARSEDLAQRAERQHASAEIADREAQAKSAEAEALEQRVGVDAKAVLAQLQKTGAELTAVRARIGVIAAKLKKENQSLGEAQSELTNASEERKQRETERSEAIERLTHLASTEILALTVPELVAQCEPPPWNVTAALELARGIEKQMTGVAMDEKATNDAANRVFTAYNVLRTALGGDFDPAISQDGDLHLVSIKFNGRMRGVTELAGLLADEVTKRRELFDEEERTLIEKHLLGDVGLHLQQRMGAARRLIETMTQQLAEHPTNSRVVVKLHWKPVEDAADVAAALKVMQKDVRLLVEADQQALVRFLRARITDARAAEGVGSSADRMARALDYRRWHRFELIMAQDGHERVMTKKAHRTGSGGSKAVLVHLPLFAAASAHYRSALPEAPHLIMLDEAFDGVDRGQRGSCMGLLVQFDLDFMITNYDEWGTYAELPGVATYHLTRVSGKLGVTALRFVWDGHTRREDDPYLEAQLSGTS